MIEIYLKRIITSKQNTFTKSEQLFANYFLTLGDKLLNKTITELADDTKSSTASIFKFIKKLGFKGYKDFKAGLASNISNKSNDESHILTAMTNINEDDNPRVIARKLMLFDIQSMYILLEEIDNLPFEKALNIIENSKRIHFIGMGGSSAIAFDCYHKFLRTNYDVNYINDFHLQLSYMTKLNKNDCVFIFSHSGKSREPIEVAKAAKENSAKVISLTSNPKSKLSKSSDVIFTLPSIEYTYKSESLNARILYLAVMDSILLSLMYSDTDNNKKAINKIRNVLKITKI